MYFSYRPLVDVFLFEFCTRTFEFTSLRKPLRVFRRTLRVSEIFSLRAHQLDKIFAKGNKSIPNRSLVTRPGHGLNQALLLWPEEKSFSYTVAISLESVRARASE